MTILLDARTSQNASTAGSIASPILVGTPVLFGQIGLVVTEATTPIRVQLSGIITLQLPLLPALTSITVTIVRGTAPTDPVVFSATSNLDLEILGPQSFSFVGSDYNVPAPPSGQLTYTAFVSSNLLGTVRVGPESLNGIAFAE
ncbi:hypothetical protein SAMN05421503_0399 [Terribacillus aidingensis]|uniref:Exosporium leader peptide n=1 Tax=Terribacillus aidingensis TaxID=586416 RepID=A0A285N2C2_9BACI|nr:hypothetical protein [Terribacillus aidingensis]SNZ03580.1 hypothetical protein SAMN05421503_0399 [Terribacillus aidingensis]